MDLDRGHEVIYGVETVRLRVASLAERCARSLWAFQPRGPQGLENRWAAGQLEEQTLRRGISTRTLYLDSVRNDVDTLDHATWLTELGAEIRTVPALPICMLVVDDKLAVVPLDTADSAKGAVVVTTSGVVAGLSALFLAVWRGAAPFARQRPKRSANFSRQERQALELWAQGYTDEVVARHLGVSKRTARRISERVASALGARSRFQAGMTAAELGLIQSSELPPGHAGRK